MVSRFGSLETPGQPAPDMLLREPGGLDDVPAIIAADVRQALALTAADLGVGAVEIFFRDPRGKVKWFGGSQIGPVLDQGCAEEIFAHAGGEGPFSQRPILAIPLEGVVGDFRLFIAGALTEVEPAKLDQAVLTAKFCLRTVRGTRLLTSVEAQADSLRAVTRMLSAVLQSSSVPQVLGALAEQIAQVTNSICVAIDSYDHGSESLARDLYTDPSWPDWEAGAERWRQLLEVRMRQMRQGQHDLGLIATWRQPWVIPDLQHPAVRPLISTEEAAFFAEAGIRTTVLQPLWVSDLFVGILSVANREVRRYQPTELELLSGMADVAAVAIRASQLMRELRTSKMSEREAYLENISRLAAAAEARDHTTGLHLENMQESVRLLADRLIDDPSEVDQVVLASIMHDIGKISVPDSILLKPSRLTLEEREIIKRHTLDGEKLLTGPMLRTGREVARWHHERWDGRGYPDGLRGDEIPLSARIVSIADVYDALVSERPYKSAWRDDAAVAEIRRNAGRQFDPRVTDVFVEIWQEGLLTPTRA